MKINRDYYPPSTEIKSDPCDIFPRGDHPDPRSDKAALQAIHRRLGIKPPYSTHTGYRVICLTNGMEFENIKEACKPYHIHYSNMLRHLKGETPMVKKMRFRFL